MRALLQRQCARRRASERGESGKPTKLLWSAFAADTRPATLEPTLKTDCCNNVDNPHPAARPHAATAHRREPRCLHALSARARHLRLYFACVHLLVTFTAIVAALRAFADLSFLPRQAR